VWTQSRPQFGFVLARDLYSIISSDVWLRVRASVRKMLPVEVALRVESGGEPDLHANPIRFEKPALAAV